MSNFVINSNVSNIEIGSSINILYLHNVSTNQMSVSTLYATNMSSNQMSVSTLYATNMSSNQMSVSTLYANNASVNQMSVSTFYSNNANFTGNLTYGSNTVATQDYVDGKIIEVTSGTSGISERIVFTNSTQNISGPKNFSQINVSGLDIYGSLSLNGYTGNTGQILLANSDGAPTWGTMNMNLSTVLSNGSWAGDNGIDMNSQNITNVNNINVSYIDSVNTSLYIGLNTSFIQIGNIDTKINMSGQVEFFTPPHIPNPVLGNDAASKGYVDSLVGQYGGSLNLFMNFSTPSSPSGYKTLSNTISDTPSRSVIIQATVDFEEKLVASFITPQLNIESLPAGVWVANINGKTLDITVPVSYVMRVYKYNAQNDEILIGGPGISTSINTLSVGDYYCNTAIPITGLDLTDRIVVKIFIINNDISKETYITTYFEGDYYSYVSTSLNAGTTLLSSNNIWTGTNNFEEFGIKTTAIDSSTSLTIASIATSLVAGNDSYPTKIKGSTVKIGEGTTDITIGNSTSNTSIIGKFNSSNISTQFIDSINTSLNIGTNTGTSLIQIGNATSNTSIIGKLNVHNISTKYIDSINTSLYIGAKAFTIQIGNSENNNGINIINGIHVNNSNTSLVNTSTPIYLWGGGLSTGTYYNTNASVYYNIDNNIITGSNGGFLLWYSFGSSNSQKGLRIFHKLNGQNQYVRNASGNIAYYYFNNNGAPYYFETLNTNVNTGSFYVIYNNVSYNTTKINNEFDYDTSGNIKIKINNVQVPLYTTTIENIVPLFNQNWQVFVNYNSDGTLVRNVNSSVNYYSYNPLSLQLELIDSNTLNVGAIIKFVNGINKYSSVASSWNANGELLFTNNDISPTNEKYYNYYYINNEKTSIIGKFNSSNISTWFIDSLNTSLFIGTNNTSLIQIGNTNSNTSILGTLNISALQINGSSGTTGQFLTSNSTGVPSWTTVTINTGLSSVLSNGNSAGSNGINMNSQNISNVSLINVSYIDSVNSILNIGQKNANTIQIGNTNSNTSIIGRLNASNISTWFIDSLNTSLFIGTRNANTSLIQIGNINSNTSILGRLNASNISTWYIDSLNTTLFIGTRNANTSLIQIGNTNSNTSVIGILNASNISTTFIDSLNTSLFIGNTNATSIKIGNNVIDYTNLNTSLINTSSPIYSTTGGTIYNTETFYNTNASIYYNINNNEITSSNGGFLLWYSYGVFGDQVALRIFNKLNNQKQYVKNASGNIAYYYFDKMFSPYTYETLSKNGNTGNFYVIYNNVSYNSTKTNGEFDYDTNGNIKIKINGVQVPLYTTTIESIVPIFTTSNWQVFVNYNPDGTLKKDGSSRVNYYAYNPYTLKLHLLNGDDIDNNASFYKFVNGIVYISSMTRNANGEALFTNNDVSPTYEQYYNYYSYIIIRTKTSILGILNASNISTTFIDSLNTSLYIGITNANTSLIQIGNTNSNTSVFGILNASNISTWFIDSLNTSLYIGTNNTSLIKIGNTNSNTSILGTLNISALQINGTSGTNGQVLTSNSTGVPSWTTINTGYINLSSVLSNGNSAGSNGINMNSQNISNVSLINVSYIDSVNSILNIGQTNAETIQIGNNILTSTNSNTVLINTSTPTYLWGTTTPTGNFFNSNASILYNIDDEIIMNSNGGFLLWYSFDRQVRIYNKLNAQNNLIRNASGNIAYFYYNSNSNTINAYNNIDYYTVGMNNGMFYVIYNNTPYQAVTINNEFVYDTTGNIVIKINNKKVPLYITTIESVVPIYYQDRQLFVNYKSDGTLDRNANASVNYYSYNEQNLKLELFNSLALNAPGIFIKLVNGVRVLNSGNWNSSNEVDFGFNITPPTNDGSYTYMYLKDNYPNNSITLSPGIMNINVRTNSSSINTPYINAINTSLYIGSTVNTSFIQIGNISNTTSILGTLNTQKINPLQSGTLTIGNTNSNTSILGRLNASNISTWFIDSLNKTLYIGSRNANTSLIQIGNTNSNTSILGMFNSSNISTQYIDSINTTLNVGTTKATIINIGGGNCSNYIYGNTSIIGNTIINSATDTINNTADVIANNANNIQNTVVDSIINTAKHIQNTTPDDSDCYIKNYAYTIINEATYIRIGNATSNTSIIGIFNSSNISTQFIDSINTSLNIGTKTGTSLIQIGNATSNTSIIGIFNSSNISTQFIDSINTSLFIGSRHATTLNIGKSGTSTIMSGGLTLGANQYITFNTNTTNPTATSPLLGSTYTVGTFVSTGLSVTGTLYGSTTSLPVGVYFVTARMCLGATAATLLNWGVLSIGSTTITGNNYGFYSIPSGLTISNVSTFSPTISTIVNIGTAGIVYMNMRGAPSTIVNITASTSLTATRIA
jgi:hypothetical protein